MAYIQNYDKYIFTYDRMIEFGRGGIVGITKSTSKYLEGTDVHRSCTYIFETSYHTALFFA
jgi:hypothetical protein